MSIGSGSQNDTTGSILRPYYHFALMAQGLQNVGKAKTNWNKR